MDDHDWTFEEDEHIYRNAQQVQRASATQALTLAGIFDYSRVPQRFLEPARRRGKNVHRVTAMRDRCIDSANRIGLECLLLEDELGYYEAWCRFMHESKFYCTAVEEQMFGSVNGYEVGGTADRFGYMRDREWVNDLKTCRNYHPGWALQNWIYDELRKLRANRPNRYVPVGKMVTQLLPDGYYKVHVFDDAADRAAALAAIALAYDPHDERAREALNNWKLVHNISTD